MRQLGYDTKFKLLRIYDSNQVEFEVKNEDEFAQLISSLCNDNIAIYNVTHKGSALESAFIHITEWDSNETIHFYTKHAQGRDL